MTTPSDRPLIRETLFESTNRAGESFQLVAFTDGTFGLLKNGSPLSKPGIPNADIRSWVKAFVQEACDDD